MATQNTLSTDSMAFTICNLKKKVDLIISEFDKKGIKQTICHPIRVHERSLFS